MVEHGWDSPLLATLSENQLEGEIVFYILGGREVGGEGAARVYSQRYVC